MNSRARSWPVWPAPMMSTFLTPASYPAKGLREAMIRGPNFSPPIASSISEGATTFTVNGM